MSPDSQQDFPLTVILNATIECACQDYIVADRMKHMMGCCERNRIRTCRTVRLLRYKWREDITQSVPFDQQIAFVTCQRQPNIHDDDRLVADALRRRGFEVTAAVWNNPAIEWPQFASVVIRAAWDYHLDQDRYVAWLHRCASQQVNLWNPPSAVRANIDKRYLADFARAGIEIVPIEYVQRGEAR